MFNLTVLCYFLDKDDDDSNDRDRKDRKDDRKSSKERSSKDKVGWLLLWANYGSDVVYTRLLGINMTLLLPQDKKQMVTFNKDLLMAFVYFDQSHCGYLLERDLEEILYTLGLHLSRAQVNTH